MEANRGRVALVRLRLSLCILYTIHAWMIATWRFTCAKQHCDWRSVILAHPLVSTILVFWDERIAAITKRHERRQWDHGNRQNIDQGTDIRSLQQYIQLCPFNPPPIDPFLSAPQFRGKPWWEVPWEKTFDSTHLPITRSRAQWRVWRVEQWPWDYGGFESAFARPLLYDRHLWSAD
jgi:hypothetical protein